MLSLVLPCANQEIFFIRFKGGAWLAGWVGPGFPGWVQRRTGSRWFTGGSFFFTGGSFFLGGGGVSDDASMLSFGSRALRP